MHLTRDVPDYTECILQFLQIFTYELKVIISNYSIFLVLSTVSLQRYDMLLKKSYTESQEG